MLMYHMSKFFGKFKVNKDEVESRRSKLIQALRSDRVGQYLLGEFRNHLSEVGITSQLSSLGTPQKNGVIERRNITDFVCTGHSTEI